MSTPAPVQYVQPLHHMDPDTSFGGVFGWCLAVPLLLVLLNRLWAEYSYRRAAQQDAAFDPDAQLREGPMVLKGSIVLEEDAPHAVQVTIRQRGTEKKGKQSWKTFWQEIGRTTDAHAFRLDTAQGLLRVEANEEVNVVHNLESSVTKPVARDERLRIITLQHDTEIYASGELVYGIDTRAARGYRGGNDTLVMRATQERPLMLSSEPLGERAKRRARTLRGWAKVYLLLTLAIQLTFVGYHMRLLSGETATAVITSHYTYTTSSKSGTTTHYVLYGKMADGRTFKDDVHYRDFDRIQDGDRVSVRYVPWMTRRERLGTDATVSVPHVLLWSILVGAMVVMQGLWLQSMRPWYAAGLKETTSGRLPERWPPDS